MKFDVFDKISKLQNTCCQKYKCRKKNRDKNQKMEGFAINRNLIMFKKISSGPTEVFLIEWEQDDISRNNQSSQLLKQVFYSGCY